MIRKKKNRFIFYLLLIGILVLVTGCKKEETDALKFKSEYESLNNTLKSVNISENNHFIYSDLDKINTMLNNKETFVVYFGYASSIEARSVVELIDSSVNELNLSKIYYVDIKEVSEDSYFSNYIITSDKTDGKSIYSPSVVSIIKGDFYSVLTDLQIDKKSLENDINEVNKALSSCDINVGC